MMEIRALARKELLHIIRDPRSLALAVLMPLLMVLLYGYAIDMDMKRLRIGILDYDQSSASRDLVRRMTSGDFIVDAGRLNHREQIETGFRRNSFRAVLVIPAGYAEALNSSPNAHVQLLIDGADGTTAVSVNNYLSAVIAGVNRELMGVGITTSLPLEARPRVFFNPELVSAHFVVPGLVAVVLVMICALLTSIAIAREKETGTMEQILTTPVRPAQVILGKVIPYVGIGVVDAVLVLAIGILVFGVPMNGSWAALAGYSLLYLIVALGMGLLISAVTRTQQMAMMIALVATMLPVFMLSGFIFPRASMPLPLQLLSQLIPATYYLQIIRGVMLKGELWFPGQLAVMTVMAVVLLTAATRRFKSRLDA